MSTDLILKRNSTHLAMYLDLSDSRSAQNQGLQGSVSIGSQNPRLTTLKENRSGLYRSSCITTHHHRYKVEDMGQG